MLVLLSDHQSKLLHRRDLEESGLSNLGWKAVDHGAGHLVNQPRFGGYSLQIFLHTRVANIRFFKLEGVEKRGVNRKFFSTFYNEFCYDLCLTRNVFKALTFSSVPSQAEKHFSLLTSAFCASMNLFKWLC